MTRDSDDQNVPENGTGAEEAGDAAEEAVSLSSPYRLAPPVETEATAEYSALTDWDAERDVESPGGRHHDSTDGASRDVVEKSAPAPVSDGSESSSAVARSGILPTSRRKPLAERPRSSRVVGGGAASPAATAGTAEAAEEAGATDEAGATALPVPGQARRTPRERAPRDRSALRRAGSILTGGLVLALAGGIAFGGGLLDRAAPATSDPLAVAVPPTQVALACPGPGVVPGGATGATDAELGGASEATASVRGLVVPRAGEPAEATLAPLAADGAEPVSLVGGDEAVLGELTSPAGSSVLRAEPSASAAAFASAASVSRADSGDLRGLAASACPAAATSSWLVGGTTLVGSSALLTLRNVGATAATVTLRAWDAVGEVTVGGTSILVPAGEEVQQALEASVPDVERLAILVTATGGQVSPTIQTSQLTGLTPAGTDAVAPTAAPALTQLLPGVVLTTTTVDEEDPTLVRILNPNEGPTTVQLDLLGAEGITSLTDEAGLVIEGGAVADVSLAGAPAGAFTLRVEAEAPVVAGAMMVRRGDPAPEDPDVPVVDRAWLPAVPSATAAAVTVPGLGSLVDRAVLVVGNAEETDADVTVTAVNAAGDVVATQEIAVGAAGSAALDLTGLGAGAVGVVLQSSTPVSSAAVLTWGDVLGEMIAVVAAQADPQVERSAAITISGS